MTAENLQIDNRQHESGLYDFAVIASTDVTPPTEIPWQPLCNIFFDENDFFPTLEEPPFKLRIRYDKWRVMNLNLQGKLSSIENSL